MGKEGRSVYLYVDLYLLRWQRPILEKEDSTIPRRTLRYSRVNSKCLRERIVRNNFGLKLVVEKVYVEQSKYVIGTASSVRGNLSLLLLACCKSLHRFVPVRPCRHLKIIFHWIKNVIPLIVV